MYDYLDLRQTEKLKELVPYKALAPDADEIIKELERLNNIINDIEEYTNENIEALENRLNSPFCNFEKVTKGLLIFQNYLDKLKELKENK